MSRRYDDRDGDYYPRPRKERNYDDELDIDIDIREQRRAPRADTVLDRPRERERGPRQPDFLREDYGKNTQAGALVIREDRSEVRDRDRDRDRRVPYPQSDRGGDRDEEIIYRDQVRSRAGSRPPARVERVEKDIDIDINIRHDHDDDARSGVGRRPPPAKSDVGSRGEYRERETEEIRFRRGGGDRAPPPPRSVVRETEEIDIRERRREDVRGPARGRGDHEEEIDIRIRDRDRSEPPPPRQRSRSRGVLVGRKEEEWIVRRPRSPSPPPPREVEKETIVIRRKERSPSPAPPPVREVEKERIIIRRRERSPSPVPVPREPTPPPLVEPIIRPPIIQEVITHHRHIDHGIERWRSPSPDLPPPAPPSPPREENLEIELHRSGTRNGKHFDEDVVIDSNERSRGNARQPVARRRSLSSSDHHTHRSRSNSRHRGGLRPRDGVNDEADYYNRRARSRGYPGEARNGATRDWGLVDIPPGTEKVRMDGIGGGRQEISWQQYNGDRRSKFVTGDSVYEDPEWARGGLRSPSDRGLPPPAPAPPRERQTTEEIRITERRITEGTHKGRTKDKMWTEITKDLVIKEAIDECGYSYEETDEFFYVIEYLRYEDVLRLVELTEDIRRERRERIRELQWEREEAERKSAPMRAIMPPPVPSIGGRGGDYEEIIKEREVYVDRSGPAWGRGGRR
ncbi:hypothetical protein B0A48_07553 [Cryoendolithus antarcticus]|uniref:DUF8035 domain-containing protein n=1 Tax=Cryoendolithus antarcticus TaxID=1507870 RepID=A0A1V8T6F2_9PEZI|nr:hypothetical protein B0A48_07553 [Cryoendolithus antarcticus]